jgi:hypothetical protein
MPWRVVALTIACSILPGIAFSQTPATESEPNNSPVTADTAVLGGEAQGVVRDRGDHTDSVDYWVVHAHAGDTIHVNVLVCSTECYDLGVSIDLFAADGVTRVAEGYGWDGNNEQLIHVATTTGPYFLRAASWGNDWPRYTLLFYARRCPADSRESNNTLPTATDIAPGTSIRSVWCPEGDLDYYRVTATPGAVLRFEMRDYSGGYYEPYLRLVDSNRRAERGVSRIGDPQRYAFEVITAAPLYLFPWGRGGPNGAYTLQLDSLGWLPPSPGDPIVTHADSIWDGALLADSAGGFWIVSGYTFYHVTSEGVTRRVANYALPSGTHGVAWDGFGNFLVGTYYGVHRVSPQGRVRSFIARPHLYGMVVGPDVIWLSEYASTAGPGYSTLTKLLHRYSLDGHLQATFDVSRIGPFAAEHLALSPQRELHFASGKGVYRLVGDVPTPVVEYAAGSEIRGLAFDSDGNLYVSVTGPTAFAAGMPISRVALYTATGQVIADPFSWWPVAPAALAFAHNADGTASRRLFALDADRLIELNPTGVRAPGLPASPPTPCPITDEQEPNDSPTTARSVTLGDAVSGVSCRADDMDFYKLFALAGTRLTIEVTGGEDPGLELRTADGATPIAFADDSLKPGERIDYTADVDGPLYVVVRSHLAGATPYVLRSRRGRPTGLTLARAARQLSRPGAVLDDTELLYLDDAGNRNGRYDAGDFRAFLRRERQGSNP